MAIAGRTTGLRVTLGKALASCNLTVADITVVELGFAATNPALENGAIDVGFQVEPFISAGIAAGLLETWKPLYEAREGQQMNVILLSPQFAQNHDAALRFLVAYIAATRVYLKDAKGTDRTQLGTILAKHLPVTDPAAYKNMIMMGIDPNGEIDLESVRESLSLWQSEGAIEPGDLTFGWISDDLRMEALSYLPPYTP